MHTGVISFCDRVGHNIKSNEVKQKILDDIENKYNTKIIQKHFYKFTEDSVKHITVTPHVVSVKTNGNPYLMYLTYYDDVEIVYFIDKKIHTSYQFPRILIGRFMFDKELFKGTLIDGEMTRNNDNKWLFIINDLISYKGEYMINKLLPERLSFCYNMLNTEYTPDDTMDICKLVIKQYFNLCKDTIENITKQEYEYTLRGIYFWAYSLKYKPKLYNIDDTLIQPVNIPIKDKQEFILKEPPLITKTFIVTDTPDAYRIVEDNTYACIQTKEESHMVRNAFKNCSANTTIQFKCLYNTKWNKWQPKQRVS